MKGSWCFPAKKREREACCGAHNTRTTTKGEGNAITITNNNDHRQRLTRAYLGYAHRCQLGRQQVSMQACPIVSSLLVVPTTFPTTVINMSWLRRPSIGPPSEFFTLLSLTQINHSLYNQFCMLKAVWFEIKMN